MSNPNENSNPMTSSSATVLDPALLARSRPDGGFAAGDLATIRKTQQGELAWRRGDVAVLLFPGCAYLRWGV